MSKKPYSHLTIYVPPPLSAKSLRNDLTTAAKSFGFTRTNGEGSIIRMLVAIAAGKAQVIKGRRDADG